MDARNRLLRDPHRRHRRLLLPQMVGHHRTARGRAERHRNRADRVLPVTAHAVRRQRHRVHVLLRSRRNLGHRQPPPPQPRRPRRRLLRQEPSHQVPRHVPGTPRRRGHSGSMGNPAPVVRLGLRLLHSRSRPHRPARALHPRPQPHPTPYVRRSNKPARPCGSCARTATSGWRSLLPRSSLCCSWTADFGNPS